MKKRWCALLLALSLALSLMVPVSAASAGMENFTEKQATYAGFSDVPANAWYLDALRSCYESKLINGVTATEFKPLDNLTLAQAIVLAARVHNLYHGGSGEFAQSTPWYQSAVDYALEEGIIQSGEAASLQNYGAYATRAQMAYLFANALPASELAPRNAVDALPDVAAKDTYADQIFALYRAGALTGNDIYGTFAPNANITRRETCAIIARVAFPEQRKSVTLYTQQTVGALSFAVPAGSTMTSESGAVEFLGPDEQNITAIFMENNNGYAGLSIADMPAELVSEILTETLMSTGIDAGAVEVEAVSFGPVAAYRSVFTIADDTTQAPCVCYLLITGSAMYMYLAASLSGLDALATMDGSLRVNGAAVSGISR